MQEIKIILAAWLVILGLGCSKLCLNRQVTLSKHIVFTAQLYYSYGHTGNEERGYA